MFNRPLATLMALLWCLGSVSAMAADVLAKYRKARVDQNVYLCGNQDNQLEYRYDVEGKFRDQIASYVNN